MSRISGEDKMDRFVAPTTSDLTPADLNWWEILQGIVLFDLWVRWAFKSSLDFCTVVGVLGVEAEIEWTNSFCKYCVSMETIVLKYIKWMHFHNKLLASFHFPVRPILYNVTATEYVNGIF